MSIPDGRQLLRRALAVAWAGIHRIWRPAMVERVLFVDAQRLGTLQATPGRPDEPPAWVAIGEFGDEWYRLEQLEAREPVAAWLRAFVARAHERPLIIDRSFIRGFGAVAPSHPAGHRSFSIWSRLTPGEVRQAKAAGAIERTVKIETDPFWV